MIPARDLDALQREIHHAKQRFGLPDAVQVVSCYEAGRDGFWLHRFLNNSGILNVVVDAASIEVNRRELASLAGLTPTPYASGDSQREQGVAVSSMARRM
jgi:transposase